MEARGLLHTHVSTSRKMVLIPTGYKVGRWVTLNMLAQKTLLMSMFEPQSRMDPT